MIGNRKITVAAALITLAACLFTLVFLLWPQSLHITAASSSPDYLSLFDPMEVLSVEITVDEDQWEQMLENAIDEEYISCDVTVNGTEYASVGIRPKGNSSLSTVYQSDSDRYSFKLEFDHYVDGQTCQGLDKFVLNNMQSDPTYVKEYLSYDLMAQMGVPTPLYCFAQIQVNGEPWGLYLAVEALEESFAQRQYGTDHSDLYKPDTMEMGGGAGGGAPGDAPDGFGDMERPGGENATEGTENGGGMAGFGGEAPFDGGLERPDDGGGGGPNGSGGGADLQYIDEDPDSYSAIFDGAVFDIDETDKARLVESLRKLSQGEDLEEVVDVDEVLRYFACNAALVNLDSYLGTMQHNYYLYEDEGQLSMLPWDYNLSFAAFQVGGAFAQRQYGTDHSDLYKPDTMEMGGGAGGGAPGDAPDGFGDMERPGGENATEGTENGGGMAGFGGEAPFDGGLERPDDGGGGGPNGSGGGADLQYIDEDPDSYSAIFDGAVFDIDETDKARLVESLRKLSQGEDLEEVVDVDEVLRYFACNAALVNLDSYLGTMQHNYYLYEDEGQLSMLPWDYNLSFAAFQVGGASAAVNFPIDTPVSGTTLEERPILGKLLEEPEYLEQYHTYLAQIAAYWAPDSFAQKLAALDALIGDYVKEDPTAFYSYEEYQQGLAMLQTYVELRVQSIEGQLDGTIPSTEEGQQQDSSNLVDASAIDLAVMGQQGGGGGGGPGGWQNGGEAMGGPVDAQTFGRTAGGETGESTTPAEDSTGSAGQGAEAAQRQAADPADGQAAPEGSSAPTDGQAALEGSSAPADSQAAPEQRTAPPQNRAAASLEGREGFQLAGATGEDGASATETGSLASLGACVAAVAGALVFAGRYQRKKR